MPKISVENVSVYGVDTLKRANSLKSIILYKKKMKDNRITILEDVNFEAKSGDRIGVLGGNGSGKSSLMKAIIGTYPVSKGKIKVTGKIVPMIELGLGMDNDIPARKNIRTMFLLNENMDLYSKEIEEEIIKFSELEEFIDMPMNKYSSGMKARLAFASSIFQDTDILILDEVFATGDKRFIEKSYEIMKKKWDKSEISIMISHSMEEIKKLCDTCYVMHDGRVVNYGKTEAMIKFYESKDYEKQ